MHRNTPDHHRHYEALLAQELSVRGFTLTATFRDELLAVMRASDDADRDMRMGLAIYRNALESGDTSACVEILTDAVHGTRRCVARTVRGSPAILAG